ncbi:MAG: nuclear transport factor 2 family protein [Planctomycetes bacterium]|nr:nuclear transport factor 2 family protein [Planctomycetota bacterium]
MLTIAIAVLAALSASAETREWRTLERDGKPPLRYAMLLPDAFDATRPTPVVLAFPPGAQTAEVADKALAQYFDVEAKRRGFVVVCPIQETADGRFFASGAAGAAGDGSEEPVLALLDHVSAQMNVEGGRFLVCGPSNGGIAALHAATTWPQRFRGVVAFPGFLRNADDEAVLAPLTRMPIALFAGGNDDPTWLERTERTRARLAQLGAVSLDAMVFPGEAHRPASLDGGVRLFDVLDGMRCATVLDTLHDAASKADGPRYFDTFTADAVFIGTDATERWTLDQFKAYAEPFFAQGKGWTYEPKERHVRVDGACAWFDERLDNAKYGATRGSGVLTRGADGTWRIAHYVLSMAVPNDKAAKVVDVIRGE